jgi:hypothetical protein
MIKWRLVLTTLPFVAIVLGLAAVRDYVLHFKGVIEFSEISPILSVVSLIIGFMLAGVLADYKEGERIPGEIAATLETIGDTVDVVVDLSKETDVRDMRSKFLSLVATVDTWLVRRNHIENCYTAMNSFKDLASRMHTAVSVNYSIRCLGELHNLRRLVTRADVIERTSFIPAGYALLDLLVASSLLLLLAANFKSALSEYFLLTLFGLIYLYLDRLIRDVDQPFMYRSATLSSTEVSPFPLHEYRERLEAMQGQDAI